MLPFTKILVFAWQNENRNTEVEELCNHGLSKRLTYVTLPHQLLDQIEKNSKVTYCHVTTDYHKFLYPHGRTYSLPRRSLSNSAGCQHMAVYYMKSRALHEEY